MVQKKNLEVYNDQNFSKFGARHKCTDLRSSVIPKDKYRETHTSGHYSESAENQRKREVS